MYPCQWTAAPYTCFLTLLPPLSLPRRFPTQAHAPRAPRCLRSQGQCRVAGARTVKRVPYPVTAWIRMRQTATRSAVSKNGTAPRATPYHWMTVNHHQHLTETPCTPIGGILFPNIHTLECPETPTSSMRTAVRWSHGSCCRNDRTGPRTPSRTPSTYPASPALLLRLLAFRRRRNLTSRRALTRTFSTVSWSHTPVRRGNRERAGGFRHSCATQAFEAACGPSRRPRCCM
ncbi:hypothetical protein DFH94DRAFT_753107 [Russula ochroleuca]|uniref:Uncharacterized protein n=1 Tax=Russula ochroleuca TaxID=152965 RepID=A0A9P5T7G2_9AGAM|nr:hypothetical protein DFH94DRAFT_753107 [Russula ochroleuca]